jgi:hypothetical protein
MSHYTVRLSTYGWTLLSGRPQANLNLEPAPMPIYAADIFLFIDSNTNKHQATALVPPGTGLLIEMTAVYVLRRA